MKLIQDYRSHIMKIWYTPSKMGKINHVLIKIQPLEVKM